MYMRKERDRAIYVACCTSKIKRPIPLCRNSRVSLCYPWSPQSVYKIPCSPSSWLLNLSIPVKHAHSRTYRNSHSQTRWNPYLPRLPLNITRCSNIGKIVTCYAKKAISEYTMKTKFFQWHLKYKFCVNSAAPRLYLRYLVLVRNSPDSGVKILKLRLRSFKRLLQ